MGEVTSNFVSEITPSYSKEPNETVLDSLFRGYEKVIFRSIVTAFGLDIFIKDQYGGDVDTIYSVRQVGIDPNMQYKKSKNSTAYEQRGDYSHKLVEGGGSNFQRIKHDARSHYMEDPRNNTVQDVYEDRPLGFLGKSKGHPTDKSAELDHVISAKSIHDDRGRVLAGLSTKELADSEQNLQWTNEHLNKSMGEAEIPDYIASHPELDEDTKNRMMDAYNTAKASYEKRIAESFYFDFSNPNCRDFYCETALAAKQRGLEMGIRQAIGFLVTELWFNIKEEIRQSDGTALGVIKAIGKGLEGWILDGKNNYRMLFEQFGEGVLSGVMSSLTSTFLNTFVTTSENVGRIVRQSWASVVEATSILLFDTKEKYYCDRMTSAAKVLASGASMIVGTTIQQEVATKLVPVAIPDELKKVIATFAGSLSTGLLSVTLLVYIDNDPFGSFLDEYYGQRVDALRNQGDLFRAYCAELQKIDIEKLNRDTAIIYEVSQTLCHIDDSEELNRYLEQTIHRLGIELPWEGTTLDAKMKDTNWVLTF